jgi:hypothetical protein
MLPDPVAPIESLTATSVMGWGAFIFGFVACVVLVWDRILGKGKALAVIDGKLDRLSNQVEEVEGRLSVVDGLAESVRELTQEWRGTPGSDNGWRSIVREHDREITAIKKRNYGLDAVREEDERRSGGQHRRRMDDELSRVLPEKREGPEG